MKRNTLFFSCAILPVALAVLVYAKQARPAQTENAAANGDTLAAPAADDTLITLIAVGDMMLGTNFPDSSLLPPGRQNILDPVSTILRDADLTFGNLEGTVLNSGGDVKKCSDPSKCYAFRQPEFVIDHLKNAGFDLLSLANNHMGDFGEPGRANTQKVLRAKGLKFAGLETCPWDTIHVNGLTVGLTAFAPNSSCLKLNDYDQARRIVRQLNEMCDIVVVSFHGGAEGSSKTHITRSKEIFLGEDRGNVHEFARVVIDAGADVVLGHGPHVTRAIDSYKGKFITYSMGNFATYKRFNLSGVSGIAPIYKLYLTRSGDFVRGELISIHQPGEGGPVQDSSERVLQSVKQLCAQDVPEIPWIFDGNVFSLK
jgi:hypothetical protein